MKKKLTKEQKFFYDKYIYFAEELAKRGDKRLLELLQQQKLNRDELLQRIANILLDYTIKDNKLAISNVEKNKIYNEFSKFIDNIVKGENNNELNKITSILTNTAKEKYNINNYLISLGLSTELKKVDNKDIKQILNKKIDGKKYSNRLYNNKEDIAKRLKQNILDLLEGNTTVNDIKDNISKTYNINATCTKRLLRNEIARVNEGINDKWCEDNKYVNYVMWSATLENNTCAECGELDGQVWEVDSNHPTPLESTHVGCRCVLVPLVNKDYRPNTRLDNNTKENINYETYNEWKQKQNLT